MIKLGECVLLQGRIPEQNKRYSNAQQLSRGCIMLLIRTIWPILCYLLRENNDNLVTTQPLYNSTTNCIVMIY